MSRREDVLRCVDVTIMDRPANTALPSSYSKTLPAFRASAAVTHATGLGGKYFVDFCEPYACVIALVPKHGSKRTPPCIQNRFRVSGPGEGRGIHIANENRTVALGQPGAQFVQEVSSAIRNLCVNRSGTRSLSSPLCAGQSRLQITIEALGIEGRQFRVTEGREALQTKIDSDARHRLSNDRSRKFRSLWPGYANIQIPTSATILIEATRPQLKVTQTEAIPQRQPPSGEVHLAAAIADRSDLEWNPAQGTSSAPAFSPREPDLVTLAATSRVFLGNLLHGLNGQMQRAIPARRTFEERPKIESRQEPPLALEHFERQVVAVVEDEIDLVPQTREPCCVLVLHPQMQHTNGTGFVTVHTYSISSRTLQIAREINVNRRKWPMPAPLTLPGSEAGVSREKSR
jgi:hypothetical protein